MAVKKHPYPRKQRLSGRLAFAAVYGAAAKQSRGALAIYLKPNELPHSRWGLSVSRRVGTAVMRNRVKRMLRESIRLLHEELPGGYDCVVVVRPHEPLALAEYQSLVKLLVGKGHKHWTAK